MKARVKATGEIVEVTKDYDLRESTIIEFYTNTEDPTDVFEKEELEFPYDSEFIDYWTRLEHQAAIAAMGGICGNTSYDEFTWEIRAEDAIRAAHALVEKLKESK